MSDKLPEKLSVNGLDKDLIKALHQRKRFLKEGDEHLHDGELMAISCCEQQILNDVLREETSYEDAKRRLV